jgi:hypothetical protein
VSRTPHRRSAPRLTRRTTLGTALLGVTALTGCDLGEPGSEDPASSPLPQDSDDPDAGLVEAVLDDIVANSLLVDSLRRRHDSLRRPLAELGRVHAAHLEVLGGESRDASGRRPSAARTASVALAQLEKRELRHEQLLADRALEAQSGRLARLLASMSAAVAQQLAELSRKGEPRGGR